MCVGVTLCYGCGGVVSVCRLRPAYGYHTTTGKVIGNSKGKGKGNGKGIGKG